VVVVLGVELADDAQVRLAGGAEDQAAGRPVGAVEFAGT
jgi:hypothetical protein